MTTQPPPQLNAEEQRTAFADFLLTLSEQVRSGEVCIAHLTQSRPSSRYYNPEDDTWTYFRSHPTTSTFVHYNVAHMESQASEEKAYVEAHPLLEKGELVTGPDTKVCSACLGPLEHVPMEKP